jgi:putative endonuclease
MALGLSGKPLAPGWLQRVKEWFRGGAGGGTPGGAGERAAAAYLSEKGYRILGVNLKCEIGEIDILALDPDGKTVVVVEVKTRGAGSSKTPEKDGMPGEAARYDPTRPEERVGRTKQRKLVLMASWAVRRYRLEKYAVRFDVVGVDLKGDGKHEVRHYVGAFESHV